MILLTLPEYDISSEMLINSVNISTEQNSVIWYDVNCVEGPEKQSWIKMFKAMATKGQTFVVRENIKEDEVIITLQSFSKFWNSGGNPNIFTELYASDTLYPSSALYPAFAVDQRVRYIELLDAANNVLLRKQVTKQTGTSVLDSMTYIAPYESVGTIAKVRWYGGCWATNTNRPGILVDEQVWAKVKTNLEALQVDKIDTRNFTPATGTKALTAAYWQGVDDSVTALTAHST